MSSITVEKLIHLLDKNRKISKVYITITPRHILAVFLVIYELWKEKKNYLFSYRATVKYMIAARTVLQGSQQGNDTSIQQVPIVVETHDVTVQHPAELQPEWAASGPLIKHSQQS